MFDSFRSFRVIIVLEFSSEALNMEDECRCVPEPEVDNEPRGEYDAQRMLEAQEQRDRAAMPEQPIAIDEVRYDTNTTQMEPQAQPVRICFRGTASFSGKKWRVHFVPTFCYYTSHKA